MNYVSQLLQEHSRANTNRITRAIGNNPDEFSKIIDIIYHAEPPLPQRAAWLLASVNDKHPELLKPYLSKFINDIQKFEVDAVRRNMTVVIASHPIPKKLQGKLIDVCFNLMLCPTEKVAMKVHAMQCIANIAKEHRELIPELKSAIEDQLPKTTAAFHARARMVMKDLEKMKRKTNA